MNEKIPNFNTFSTLVDRISIENVKKVIFEERTKEANPKQKKELNEKIQAQDKILSLLKEEFTEYMEDIWINEDYQFIGEKRTFSS